MEHLICANSVQPSVIVGVMLSSQFLYLLLCGKVLDLELINVERLLEMDRHIQRIYHIYFLPET